MLFCSPDTRITAIKQGQACTGTEHLHSLTLRRYSGSLGRGFEVTRVFKNKESPEPLVRWNIFNPFLGTLPHSAGGHKKPSCSPYRSPQALHNRTEFPLLNKMVRKPSDKTPLSVQRHAGTFTAIRLLLDCLVLGIHDNLKSEARSARQENKD